MLNFLPNESELGDVITHRLAGSLWKGQIYDAGNEYIRKTGGFEQVDNGGVLGTFEKNQDFFRLYVYDTEAESPYTSIRTEFSIDLTAYNEIQIEWENVGHETLSRSKLDVTKESSGGTFPTLQKNGSFLRQWSILEIPHNEGRHFISAHCHLVENVYGAGSDLYIYAIKLIR